MPILGPLISAGASLLGGLFGRSSQAKANEQNIKLQREFAQKGVQWKVADARAAGVHPLFALGAQTTSFQPNLVGDTSLPNALAAAGQDIGRAVSASATPEVRGGAVMAKLAMERAGLENDLLRSQIRQINSAGNPPGLPGAGVDSSDPMIVGGREVIRDPNFGVVSMPRGPSANELQGKVGEVGDWIAGFRYVNEWMRKNTGRPLVSQGDIDRFQTYIRPWLGPAK